MWTYDLPFSDMSVSRDSNAQSLATHEIYFVTTVTTTSSPYISMLLPHLPRVAMGIPGLSSATLLTTCHLC